MFTAPNDIDNLVHSKLKLRELKKFRNAMGEVPAL